METEIHIEMHTTQKSQNNFEKEKEHLYFPISKLTAKLQSSRQCDPGIKDSHIESCNGIDSQEISPYI